jgi:pre-mRNA-splicing factor SYF1
MSNDVPLKMFTVYIAKAAANYGLTATRPIYERALEVLPDRQTAKMCLRFAALERKLGEIDRARAIYAHASQFCDPRTNPEFWVEWHAFEIDTGSEDTFREMLRIKRSVQAQFNTEASYLAAQALAASQGAAKIAEEEAALDPMAAAERQTDGGKGGPTFVSAKQSAQPKGDDEQAPSPQVVGNADEIQISDEDI